MPIRIENFCGELSLRQSAALVAQSDFTYYPTVPSPCTLPGLSKSPALTVLGEWYDSAQLHKKAMGLPGRTGIGKGIKSGIPNLFEPEEVFDIYKKHAIQESHSLLYENCFRLGQYNPKLAV